MEEDWTGWVLTINTATVSGLMILYALPMDMVYNATNNFINSRGPPGDPDRDLKTLQRHRFSRDRKYAMVASGRPSNVLFKTRNCMN